MSLIFSHESIVKMEKKVSVLQSNYIPWKGYFDLINMVDEFILYDEMQYTKNDWRNRNQIKTQNGSQWLTIPVKQTKLSQKIKDTKIAQINWGKKHWNALCTNYSKAPFFKMYKNIFENLYLNSETEYISLINYSFITKINEILGIKTKVTWSMDYKLGDGKTQRLVNLCIQAGASEYLSGPAAKEYIDSELFRQAGIKLTWMDYSGYPEYSQRYPLFEHNVSILDLIFNCGPESTKYMKSFGETK